MRSSCLESAAETPRNCPALAGTPVDLATRTKLPRTASTVCWSEARSEVLDNRRIDRIRHESYRSRNFTARRNGFELDVHTASRCSNRAMLLIRNSRFMGFITALVVLTG